MSKIPLYKGQPFLKAKKRLILLVNKNKVNLLKSPTMSMNKVNFFSMKIFYSCVEGFDNPFSIETKCVEALLSTIYFVVVELIKLPWYERTYGFLVVEEEHGQLDD